MITNVTEAIEALDDHGTALPADEVAYIRNVLDEFQRVAWIFENMGPLSIDIPGHGRVNRAVEGWGDFRQLMNEVPIKPERSTPTGRP